MTVVSPTVPAALWIRRISIAAIAILVCLMFVHVPASAEGSQASFSETSFVQRDTDGDGSPDTAEIHCQCYSSDDRITVIDGAENMAPATTIDAGTDMENDLWLFDVGNRGRYQIAVQFGREGSTLTADIYQDQDGNGSVATGERDGHTVGTEPGFPSIHVVALDGFWQRAGRMAPNLDITVDDRMLATFGGELYEQAIKNDGQPDVVIHVRGPHEGEPRTYDWRNVYAPVPADWGIYRTTLMVRERGEEPAFPPVFPWYLLGGTYGAIQDYAGGTVPTTPLAGVGSRPYGIVKPYGQSFPPIQVDWNSGKIAYVGEFVASRGSDTNWFTYSINRIEPGKVTDRNFESPFAFYDLAGDNDSIPELEVRAERIVADDPYVPLQWRGRAYQQIRYSWEQREGQGWSYKLGLLGQHPIEGRVEFPEFTLQTIPYAQYPNWVTTRNWDIATFVAVERDRYNSSEGIYEWGPTRTIRDEYYAGTGPPPEGHYQGIGSGMRGEYTLRLDSQPYIYFSPVDARLHLVGAGHGVYQVDDTRRVEYRNLAGSTGIDSWQLYNGDAVTAELHQLSDGLIYSGDGEVSLLKADVPAESFRILPPTNHDEWVKLGEQLDENKSDIAGDDLRAMFDQFAGERLTIAGGTMSGFRLTSGGYRFVLDLQPDYDLGTFPVTGITGPGRYVLEHDNASGQFTAQASSPPSPAIESITTSGAASELEPVDLSINLANTGLEDVTTIPLIVTAERPGDKPHLIAEQTIDLLGAEHPTIQASWPPPDAGSWKVTARLYPPGGGVVERMADLKVEAAPGPSWSTVVTAGWPSTWPLAYLGALLGLIALPVASGLLLVKRLR